MQPSMSRWSVDNTSEPGVLRLTIVGALSTDQVHAFHEAHNRAIDEYRGNDYRVWVDLTQAAPLSPAGAEIFEKAKRYSSKQPNFRGSSVLVASAIISMQHRRTSVDGGVMETEMISHDENALRAHLRSVYRRQHAR